MRAALPFGLWVPVLPGTRQVTIGGAIASDIHGKNHHSAGSFGQSRALDGSAHRGRPDPHPHPGRPEAKLFLGHGRGMGLTGIILKATIEKTPTETRTSSPTATSPTRSTRPSPCTATAREQLRLLERVVRRHRARAQAGPRRDFPRQPREVDQLPTKLQKNPLKFDAPTLLTFPEHFPNGLANNSTSRRSARCGSARPATTAARSRI